MTDYDDRLEAYAETAASALPPGAFWQGFRDYDGTGRELLRAKAQTWLDVDLAAERLVAESQPARASEMLADHETQVGLPDCCFQTLNVNIEDRRNAVLTRYRAQGGQSPQYFIDMAKSLGYDVTITENRPFVCGLSEIGGDSSGAAPVTRLDTIGADRFSWKVVVPEPRVTWFRCGSGVLGQDALATINRADDLECLLARYQPAQQELTVSYRGLPEPVLSVWAVPGLPLPDPFVFSRTVEGIGFNATGQYTMVESGVQRDYFDPETYEYKGKLFLPSFRSSCANYNAAPIDLTGIQGPFGNANAVISVVMDAEELGKVHILKQLLREGTLNGNVFKLDNSLGAQSAYITVTGSTVTAGAITTISGWCRTDIGGAVDMAGGFGGQPFSNTSYQRIHKTVDMPDGYLGQLAVVAEPGATVWFILNQCEVSEVPSFVPVITQGAAFATAADVLTMNQAQTGEILVPFDGWDGEADGHTIMLDHENPLIGKYWQNLEALILGVSNSSGFNSWRLYQMQNTGGLSLYPQAAGVNYDPVVISGAGAPCVFGFDTTNVRLASRGTPVVTGGLIVPPVGLDTLYFPINEPLILKRFVVYNRYLPVSVVQALVRE